MLVPSCGWPRIRSGQQYALRRRSRRLVVRDLEMSTARLCQKEDVARLDSFQLLPASLVGPTRCLACLTRQ